MAASTGSPVQASSLRIIARGLDRPESVTAGPDGLLYAGGWEGQIYRIDPDSGRVEEIANIGGTVLGLCLDADGAIYACNVRQGAVFRIAPDGTAAVWSSSADGRPYLVPNYCAFGRDGSLWLTDSGAENPGVPTGRIVRIPREGGDGVTVSQEPLDFPNGLCLDAAGGVVFLESFGYGVSRLVDGTIERIVALDGVTPDGIAIDESGGFVIACFYPYQLLYVEPGAQTATVLAEDRVGITMKMPANVIHYGADRRKIAIAGLGGDVLLGLDAPRPGLALHYPGRPS
jgi:gluconolactonase